VITIICSTGQRLESICRLVMYYWNICLEIVKIAINGLFMPSSLHRSLYERSIGRAFAKTPVSDQEVCGSKPGWVIPNT